MTQVTEHKTVPPVESENLRKGAKTRDRILDAAYDAIIHKGFTGTSIDELVAAAEITKSGFFYHFKDKNDLARHLLARFLAEDDAIMDELTQRAHTLTDDPLQRFLLFLNLYAELVDEMEALHPGCLVASIVYQDQAFDGEVKDLNAEGVLRWRERFERFLKAIEKKYSPTNSIDTGALADGMSAVVEGAIVLSKALGDPKLLGRQIRLYRDVIKTTYGAA